MAGEPEVRIEPDLYVNEATLEFFTNRFEARLRRAFWSFTVPLLGIAGLAVAWVVLFEIPRRVPSFIQEDATVRALIEDAAAKHLQGDEGAALIAGELPRILTADAGLRATLERKIEEFLADPTGGGELVRRTAEASAQAHTPAAVRAFYESDDGKRILREQFGEVLPEYFARAEGAALVKEIVAEGFASPATRDTMKEILNESFLPVRRDRSRSERDEEPR